MFSVLGERLQIAVVVQEIGRDRKVMPTWCFAAHLMKANGVLE